LGAAAEGARSTDRAVWPPPPSEGIVASDPTDSFPEHAADSSNAGAIQTKQITLDSGSTIESPFPIVPTADGTVRA
jgi:hypothetical protein